MFSYLYNLFGYTEEEPEDKLKMKQARYKYLCCKTIASSKIHLKHNDDSKRNLKRSRHRV